MDETRHRTTQPELLGFLQVDLETAFTFLHSSDMAIRYNPARAARLVERANEALATIRKFAERLLDADQLAKF